MTEQTDHSCSDMQLQIRESELYLRLSQFLQSNLLVIAPIFNVKATRVFCSQKNNDYFVFLIFQRLFPFLSCLLPHSSPRFCYQRSSSSVGWRDGCTAPCLAFGRICNTMTCTNHTPAPAALLLETKTLGMGQILGADLNA